MSRRMSWRTWWSDGVKASSGCNRSQTSCRGAGSHLPLRQRLAAGAWPAPWAMPDVDHGLTVDCAPARGAARPSWRPFGVCLKSRGPASHARVPHHGDSRHPNAFAERPQRGRGDSYAAAGRARGTGGGTVVRLIWSGLTICRFEKPGRGGPGPPGRAPIGAPVVPCGRTGQRSSDGVSAHDWTA